MGKQAMFYLRPYSTLAWQPGYGVCTTHARFATYGILGLKCHSRNLPETNLSDLNNENDIIADIYVILIVTHHCSGRACRIWPGI
jgi:hypothetical protein